MRSTIQLGGFLLASFVLIGGCYPALTPYFEPSAKGGRVAGSACHGSVGPRDSITFEQHGLGAIVTVQLYRDKEFVTIVLLKLPANRSVTLGSQDILTNIQSQQTRSAPVQIKRFILHPHFEETVNNLDHLLDPKFDAYSLHYPFPSDIVDAFRLRLPPISVDGQDLDLPDITFVRKNEWFIYPINC